MRAAFVALEGEEPLDLPAQVADPLGDRVLGVEHAARRSGRGSPISPVDPPTSPSGLCPASWMRRIVSSCTRLPRCRLGAVGSKPQ